MLSIYALQFGIDLTIAKHLKMAEEILQQSNLSADPEKKFIDMALKLKLMIFNDLHYIDMGDFGVLCNVSKKSRIREEE